MSRICSGTNSLAYRGQGTGKYSINAKISAGLIFKLLMYAGNAYR